MLFASGTAYGAICTVQSEWYSIMRELFRQIHSKQLKVLNAAAVNQANKQILLKLQTHIRTYLPSCLCFPVKMLFVAFFNMNKLLSAASLVSIQYFSSCALTVC